MARYGKNEAKGPSFRISDLTPVIKSEPKWEIYANGQPTGIIWEAESAIEAAEIFELFESDIPREHRGKNFTARPASLEVGK